ncbi:MAG: PAT family beta-lactamase induction signal transducer AmpG [Candidatus Azotimanducaceae bacterium]|jgi:PAT family beta-lactamase induction signal transducer AmpG
MMFLGFSGGLPFLLVFSTLTAWLSDEGVSKSAIGFFAWVGITYSIKVVWAPVVDRLAIPFLTHRLGQRRSWMLVGQIGIAVGLILMSFIGATDLYLLSMAALIVAFSSATQDIAIDAYRIEAQDEKYQGAMSATYIFGYRVALLAAGAGALYMASYYNWVIAYQAMALLTLVGIVTVLLIEEPVRERDSLLAKAEAEGQSWSRGVFNSVINPFVDFFTRNSGFALFILLFIAVFRLSDIAMGIMANPFYLDMGYTKIEIANVAKVFGFFMSIAGAAICGLLVVKWGIYRCLLVGAIAVAATNVLFAGLSLLPAELSYLAVVISADNISGGFAATAFVAYLSSLTNRAYTATQYALFSSLMTLPGKFLSGFSGLVVDDYGYFEFFLVAAALGLPAILMVIIMMRRPV